MESKNPFNMMCHMSFKINFEPFWEFSRKCSTYFGDKWVSFSLGHPVYSLHLE